jgi:hypothetical protein
MTYLHEGHISQEQYVLTPMSHHQVLIHLNTLHKNTTIDKNTRLYSFDIMNMYTNIPTMEMNIITGILKITTK